MNNMSDEFYDAFTTHITGCSFTCNCGKEHYDNYNTGYDWEEGEYEGFQNNPNAQPHNCSVGSIIIAGKQIVWDCDCKEAQAYEDFIVEHAEQIAKFLNARANRLKKESEKTRVLLKDNNE